MKHKLLAGWLLTPLFFLAGHARAFDAGDAAPEAAVAHDEDVKPAYRKVFAPRLPESGEALLLELTVGNLPRGTILRVEVAEDTGRFRLVGAVSPFPAGSTRVIRYDIGFLKVPGDVNLFEKSAYLALSVVDREGRIVGPGDEGIVQKAALRVVKVTE